MSVVGYLLYRVVKQVIRDATSKPRVVRIVPKDAKSTAQWQNVSRMYAELSGNGTNAEELPADTAYTIAALRPFIERRKQELADYRAYLAHGEKTKMSAKEPARPNLTKLEGTIGEPVLLKEGEKMNFWAVMSTYKGRTRLALISANKSTGFNGALYSIPVDAVTDITHMSTSIGSLAANYEKAKASASTYQEPAKQAATPASTAGADTSAFWTALKGLAAADPTRAAAVSVYEATKNDVAAFAVISAYAGPMKAAVDALRGQLVPVRK